MKLDITEIKTLYSIYRVIYQKKVMLDNRAKLGTISFNKSEIKISTKQLKQDQIETLFHEYIHILFEELEIEPLEEREVNALSRSLVKFIKENRELIEIILDYKGEKVSGRNL